MIPSLGFTTPVRVCNECKATQMAEARGVDISALRAFISKTLAAGGGRTRSGGLDGGALETFDDDGNQNEEDDEGGHGKRMELWQKLRSVTTAIHEVEGTLQRVVGGEHDETGDEAKQALLTR